MPRVLNNNLVPYSSKTQVIPTLKSMSSYLISLPPHTSTSATLTFYKQL